MDESISMKFKIGTVQVKTHLPFHAPRGADGRRDDNASLTTRASNQGWSPVQFSRNSAATPASAAPRSGLPAALTETPVAPLDRPLAVMTPDIGEGSFALNCEKQTLGFVVPTFAHPDHGRLTIGRHAKDADSRQVRFSLSLKTPGTAVDTVQTMYVTQQDPDFGNRSTLGYSDIDLPEAMEGRGIGTALHLVAAHTARELGVQQVVVQSVVSPAMEVLCERMGMTETAPGSFAADPAAMERACRDRIRSKGWTS
jgi:hypothetical protein